MGLVKAVQHQVGLSATISQNFTITAEDADGTLKIKRGTESNYTSTPLTIDPNNYLVGDATAPQFDATKKLATDEFVQRALGNFSSVIQASGLGATILLDNTYVGKVLAHGDPVDINVTMPPLSGVSMGGSVHLHNTSSKKITLVASGSDLLTADGQIISSVILLTGDTLTLYKATGLHWFMYGSAVRGEEPGFKSSLVSNGYQKLPSGLIIQWGTTVAPVATANVNSTKAMLYPIPFPITAMAVYATPANSPAGNYVTTSAESPGITGFSLLTCSAIALPNLNVRWIALGH